MKPKVIGALVLGILFLIILLQNTQVVSMRLLFWEISMSRIILFPLVLLVGFVIGFFVGRKPRDW
ncbi:LapA family protein [Candidatus Omnitrophota bacterium]